MIFNQLGNNVIKILLFIWFVCNNIITFVEEKQRDMKVQKFFHRGTEINKIAFSEIEYDLEDKGIDVMKAFMLMADENENVYVSNGFLRGLGAASENEDGEWHHYFKKDEDGSFEAFKFKFND